MINKLRKKFIIYALLSVFFLLLIILGSINITNFSLLSRDADRITQMIADNKGTFKDDSRFPQTQDNDNSNPFSKDNPQQGSFPNGNPGQNTNPFLDPNQQNPNNGNTPYFDPNQSNNNENPNNGNQEPFAPGKMGPSSPETNKSIRYFTISYDKDENANVVSFNISAMNENNAISLAKSLLKSSKGWVNVTYRYMVYKVGNLTYVTVIDQGREMLPSLRVLYASIIGSVVGLLITFIVLLLVSKKLVKPIEEADRKQKRFISDAARDLKNPSIIIDADLKVIEEKYGEFDETKSIKKQVRKLNDLSKNLNTLSIISEYENVKLDNVNLNYIVLDCKTKYENIFNQNNINLNIQTDEKLIFNSNEEMLRKVIDEIFNNSSKFSNSYCNIKVYIKDNRLYIEETNDALYLPNGSLDRIFERFYRLENSDAISGTGLGLSIVKEIVTTLNGRIYASGNEGEFKLKIEL